MGNDHKTVGYGCFAVNLVILLVLALGIGFVGYLLGVGAMQIEQGPGVAVLEIRSDIYDEQPIIEQIDQLLDDPDTCALVVHVDSPGGAISAVEEIFQRLQEAASDGLPVVSSMGAMAASGGYFVSLAGERIFANRTSITGSIGVLIEYYSASGLLGKIGVDFDMVTSGQYKGLGSWGQPLNPAEREHIQGIVNDFHEFFVETISEQRHIELPRVREMADGRVFTGRQAVELGLVDEIGGLDSAIRYAGERARIEGEPRVIRVTDKAGSLLQTIKRYGLPPWGAAGSRPVKGRTGPEPGVAMYLMR